MEASSPPDLGGGSWATGGGGEVRTHRLQDPRPILRTHNKPINRIPAGERLYLDQLLQLSTNLTTPDCSVT